jgi:acyl-CoA synthetase (AMP-forming)/AMP-acid ligase II/thioesterase domain-containing protein
MLSPATFSSADVTVHGLITHWATKAPAAIAVTAARRTPMTYAGLSRHIETTIGTLNKMGVGRNDRVILVLPNGPDMAVAFLAVASAATCAPLNPYYRREEFDFFIRDLKPEALIVQSGMDSPAISIAKERGISLIRLSPVPTESAGVFTLSGEEKNDSFASGFAQPADVALVLHTSGTTSRPKMVPLSHTNICNSANNIVETLGLNPSDRCLNIMPLFHIHGLIGALLATITAGASIFCTPGFYAPRFFKWVKEFQPTWYTAVPTIHQAIVDRSKENPEIVRQCKFRFIRSSSAPLSPQCMADLERTFGTSVIESYGMTEASHQIASNPLPPRKRKPGSVGLATGPEIGIMDEEGNMLSQGDIGEIVIRGITVTRGYENNPEANQKSFTNGWFRTGDQGYFDEDNYLIIRARVKEIINRGGEKISPREIDEVILDHPAVAQAVTFAIPHPTLGEDVAAAIVPRDEMVVTEWEIQKFVAKRLADFKVPRRVIIIKEIPKGPTGKIQRIGLAEKLGVTISSSESVSKAEYRAPSTPLEENLLKIWSEVLQLDSISVNDNFFELGGDSIQARAIASRVCKELHLDELPLAVFLHAPTIEKMAKMLSEGEFPSPSASLRAVQPEGSNPPLYFVHACDGEILYFTDLARRLGSEQPFYALRAQGLDRNTTPINRVEDMAAHYLAEIEAVQPEGPYLLGGAGVGGIIALEMAQVLLSQSKSVGMLVLIDTRLPKSFHPKNPHPSTSQQERAAYTNKTNWQEISRRLTFYLHRALFYLEHGREALRLAMSILTHRRGQISKALARRYSVMESTANAVDTYSPSPYPGQLVIFLPEKRHGFPSPETRIQEWRQLAAGRFDARVIPGEHLRILREPYVKVLAAQLRVYLDEATKQMRFHSPLIS